MALTFDNRADEIKLIGGSPTPDDLATIVANVKTLRTSIDGASGILDEAVALIDDKLLEVIEMAAIEYRDQ